MGMEFGENNKLEKEGLMHKNVERKIGSMSDFMISRSLDCENEKKIDIFQGCGKIVSFQSSSVTLDLILYHLT